LGFGHSIFYLWEYCTDPQSYQITSKASGRGPVAVPGFGASSPAAWSIGHARPYVSEVTVVRKDLQDILVHINRRFTMYHPWVLKLDLIIGSNVLIFKNNSPWLILSNFRILERPASGSFLMWISRVKIIFLPTSKVENFIYFLPVNRVMTTVLTLSLSCWSLKNSKVTEYQPREHFIQRGGQ